MTEHERFREMLARRSELPSQEEELLREHLDDCPDCRETATAYSRQTALLRSLPVADPPPALRAAVLSGIHGRRVLSFWRRPAVALAPVAARAILPSKVRSHPHRHRLYPDTRRRPARRSCPGVHLSTGIIGQAQRHPHRSQIFLPPDRLR
jgi:hypothetical protein